MPTLKVHHIGYLVKKIEPAVNTFKALGYEITQDTVFDEIRHVNICFLEKDGYRIELISPVSDKSVVYNLLKRFKNCPYHICYETTDFEKDYEVLRAKGFMPIDSPAPAPALQNREVVFLTSTTIGMIELLKK